MTPKQADKIIAEGKTITVRSKFYGEEFSARFIKRDRLSIESEDGGRFDRSDLEIIERTER